MWGSNCDISMRRRQQEGANFSGTRTMLRFRLKSLLWLAQKGPLYGLVVLVILGSMANAMHRCSRTRQGSLLVTNCQGQGHVAVPDADPSSQAFLLNFNHLSLIQNSSFPVMKSLQILSLGGQLKGSLFVGERAFQNVSTNLTFLDLGGNKNLTFHPRAFMGLGKLEVLLLDTNGLDEAVLEGGFFRDLVSLKRLDLSGNSIGRVRPDPTFLALKRLSVLQLKLNRIEAICRDDLQNLCGRHLSLLDLSANRLRNRHRCTNPFRNITLGTLDISSNSLNAEEAEKFFAVLNGTQIRQLKMQRSAALGKGYGFRNLKDISAFTFSGLCSSGVVALDMSYGFLNQLHPSVFLLLPDLYALLLRSNQISRIRKGAFAGLKHLRILDLSHNLLGELRRESLKALRASPLQQLILKSNHIGVIQHDALAGLDALEMLDLADNALSRIPSGKLPALLYLKLRGNRFRDAWGLEKLGKKLIYLDFSSNYLSDVGKIWAPVGGIPTLNFLNLSHNQLESCFKVPPGPRQLRYLDLAHNRLGKIWERGSCVTLLQPLGELVFLNLSFNLLQTLPRGLFQGLVSLQILDLSSNHLSILAEEAFLGLKSLRNLSLEGNPLRTLSPSVFSPLEELRSLNLMGLALSCHCGLAPLQTWMRDKERTVSGLVFTVSCTQTAPSFQKVSLARFLHEKCGQEHADTLKTY